MLVLKFGGSSVASSENISIVKDVLFDKAKSEKLIVVVSALGGITSQLINCTQLAEQGKEEYLNSIQEIEERHQQIVTQLISMAHQGRTLGRLKVLFNELEDIFRGVYLIRELSKKTNDRILSYGELLSSTIIHDFLSDQGANVSLVDPRELIITDNHFGKANVYLEKSNKKISNYFKDCSDINVCPGFIAANEKGESTTLGRGGSDYTAAIIAAALNAPRLEIWTDVSGMMTADPRMVSSAYAIKEISYEEAMELSHFGAKVIYPPTIQPVLEKNIPIHVKNTFRKDDHGTLISSKGKLNGKIIKGISCIENIALLNLSGSGMVGIPNFSHRLFRALSTAKVNVIMITQASSEHSICVGIDQGDALLADEAIKDEFKFELSTHQVNPLEVERNLSIVALVGSNMKHQVGVSGQMFSVLGKNGVNIKAIAQGSSEKNISAVIDSHEVKKALNSLHESFFLSEKRVLNVFVIGMGNVGGAMLEQFRSQKEYLVKHHHIDLRVIALANSKKMLFQEKGIDLDNWDNLFNENAEDMQLDLFLKKMYELNLRNSIFIDNTANELVASKYNEILKESISVVTPNKIACTNSFSAYLELKQTALKYKTKFLFETNVGAGLPVINTLSDLIKSGDEVLRIDAVLSGSLNFIFNNYNKEIPFHDIVKRAQEEGYTEPDPRIDLSGIDVMRKILILIRESGYKMEINQVSADPFIPEDCMNAPDVESFFKGLVKHEEVFQNIFDDAQKEGCKLKYVASFDNGKAVAGLRKIDPSHPLFNLEGKDNIVLFTTKRYPEQPLVIKGAGAGAAVTASGIFADVMRIANS